MKYVILITLVLSSLLKAQEMQDEEFTVKKQKEAIYFYGNYGLFLKNRNYSDENNELKTSYNFGTEIKISGSNFVALNFLKSAELNETIDKKKISGHFYSYDIMYLRKIGETSSSGFIPRFDNNNNSNDGNETFLGIGLSYNILENFNVSNNSISNLKQISIPVTLENKSNLLGNIYTNLILKGNILGDVKYFNLAIGLSYKL